MKPLKAPSNIIELKKDKTYLFVFDQDKTGLRPENVKPLVDMLNGHGFHGDAILIKDASGLTVFEKELE